MKRPDEPPTSRSPDRARVTGTPPDGGHAPRHCHASQLDAAREDLLRDLDALQARVSRSATLAGWLRDAPPLRACVALARRLAGRPAPETRRPLRVAGRAGPGPATARARRDIPGRRLRVAAIVDPFTALGLGPECDLHLVDTAAWEAGLEAFAPDVLFVESAWEGNGGQWRDGLVPASPALHGVLAWCGRNGVPTVFWNKEDPTHFEHFLPVARHFDFIYTTAAECVPRYRARLARDAVGVLPFACQPRLHNPVAAGERKVAACFAGTYYVRYAERAADFDRLVSAVAPVLDVEILDRNHGKGIAEFAFPARYRPMVRPGVPAGRVHEAYREYLFGLNLNTVKDSPTMFARRVFELLACNTAVLSNPSEGMQRLFGDLVLVEAPGFVASKLVPLLGDASRYRRFRLAGLRKVMSEHTWAHRVAQLSREVLGRRDAPVAPAVHVVARPRDAGDLARIVAAYERQAHASRHLVLLLDEPPPHGLPPGTQCLDRVAAQALRPADAWPGAHVAWFSGDDTYGPGYLHDLALGTRYAAYDTVGKACHYRQAQGGTTLVDDGAQYRPSEQLPPRRAVVRAASIDGSLSGWADAAARDVARSGLALDEFNYCEGAAGAGAIDSDVDPALDTGVSLARFLGDIPAASPAEGGVA